MSEFEVKDSGIRKEYASGMRRDIQEGKPRYDLIEDRMLERLAAHLAKGAIKYTEDNWKLANSIEELRRFKASAIRHMYQWKRGIDIDEDHAAAIMFNVIAAEYVKDKLGTDINGDIWLAVPSLRGIEVNEIGAVRRSKDGFVYSQWTNIWGYRLVSLSGQARRHYQVHRLVAEAFLGEASDMQVNHINGNKQDNSILNLEYVTAKENNKHARETGLTPRQQRGKIDYATAELIRDRVANGEKQKDLAKEFGITPQAVNDLARGRTWAKDIMAEEDERMAELREDTMRELAGDVKNEFTGVGDEA